MKQRLILLLAMVLIVAYGCNEDDLVQLDPNRVVPESFFETEGQLESTVLSAYAPLRSGNLVGRLYYFLHDMSDDSHAPTSALFPVAQQVSNCQQTPTAGEIGGMWGTLYLMIHRTNTAIEGIESNTTVDQSVKNGLLGEARFLRGWAYNELATLYGGAPIYLERVSNPESSLPRSPRSEVFAQAQADLQFAADNLPASRGGDNLGRATSGSANGILARSFMQSNDLSAAKTAALAVVNSGNYSLNENFLDNFTEENDFTEESLFEVVYAPIGDYNWNAGSGDGTNAKSVRAQEYGPAWRNVTPSSNIINAFENELRGDAFTDPRLAQTVIFEGDSYANGTETLAINANGPMVDYHGTQVFVNWYKYCVYYARNPGGYYTTTTNHIIQRYADILLLLAEIEARDGNLDAARAYINQVRARVGIPNIEDSRIPSGTQSEVIMAVIHEREVELASEQVRGRDLKRWHEAGLINMADFKSCFSEKDLLFPIPLQELITNPNINQENQNAGYN